MYPLLTALGQVLLPAARLSEVDQMVIETMAENGFSSQEIGERFGYDPQQVEEAIEALPLEASGDPSGGLAAMTAS